MILGAVGATTGVVARFLYELLLFELTAQMAITIHLLDSADMVGCLVLSPRGHMELGMLQGYSPRQKFWPWHAPPALKRNFCIYKKRAMAQPWRRVQDRCTAVT